MLPNAAIGAHRPAQPPSTAIRKSPLEALLSNPASLKPIIGFKDAPRATTATSAAAKASQDVTTPAKLPKVPGHDLSPPSVEGAEQKKTRTGQGPFSPGPPVPQEEDVGGNAGGKD